MGILNLIKTAVRQHKEDRAIMRKAYENARVIIKAQAEAVKKQKQYDDLVGESLNYRIIQDLINAARSGAGCRVTLKDGNKLEFFKVDPMTMEEQKPHAKRWQTDDSF